MQDYDAIIIGPDRRAGLGTAGNIAVWNRKETMPFRASTLLNSMLPRSGERGDRIAHSYRNDSRTIFLYGGDFVYRDSSKWFGIPMTGVCRGKDNTMSKSFIDSVRHEEETLGDELPDVILEAAGSKGWEQAGNSFTLAFCTGLDTCPSMRERAAVYS